ncbi:hypothetical protein B9Z55_019441 [Caenorhabditis nigoni]|uniref:Uncharacterized protein n=1 Tax=Caenorhabditis nigoni TaxID=1611254 RepID=A0A2G5TIE8_9PELO|nr:hypothetical protein B9Z55_019441 [Caenorhabditis nigoni]
MLTNLQFSVKCYPRYHELFKIIEQQSTPPEGPTQKLEEPGLRLRTRNTQTQTAELFCSDNGHRKTDNELQTTEKILPRKTDTDNGQSKMVGQQATDNELSVSCF